MSTVVPIRSERQIIEQYADTIADLGAENHQLQSALDMQAVLCQALAHEVTALTRRHATRSGQRRKRELVAYLIGVSTATAVLVFTYLLATYDLAQFVGRALRVVGW